MIYDKFYQKYILTVYTEETLVTNADRSRETPSDDSSCDYEKDKLDGTLHPVQFI